MELMQGRSTNFKTDGTLCSGTVDVATVLGDDDAAGGVEAMGGGAGGLHERMPLCVGVGCRDGTGSFGRADGFARASLREEVKNCGF